MKMNLSEKTLLIRQSLLFLIIISFLSMTCAIGQTHDRHQTNSKRGQSTLRKIIEERKAAGRNVSITASKEIQKSTKATIKPAGVNTLDLIFQFMFGKNGGVQGDGFGDGEFAVPSGVDVNSLDEVFVVDTGNDRVQVFDASGNYLRQFGSFGSGDGEFDSPQGIAIDSDDNVYVSDSFNARIQKFDSNGNFILEWGSFGSGDGQFEFPVGIAVDSINDVYVVDFDLDRIQRFEPDGTFVVKWGSPGSGAGEFDGPVDIDVDSSDVLYVTDYLNDRVQKFSIIGTYLGEWASDYALGIALDGNNDVYVVQYDLDRVQKTDSAGVLIFNFGSYGSGDGEFDYPQFIGVDSSNNVYISDEDNHRIQKFNSSGTFLLKWGANGGIGASYGDGDGEFDSSGDIALDTSGNIFVTDILNHRVQKFDANGNYLDQFGDFGTGNGQFLLPSGIAFDSNGNIYVVDVGNFRIQKFGPDLVYISQWGSFGSADGQFNFQYGIAVDALDRVFVADRNNDRIQVFDVNGGHLQTIGSAGSGDGQLDHPQDVTFDSAGNLYVAEEGNERISKFDSTGNFLTKWGTAGSGDGQFEDPWGITIDGDDNVYVLDNYHSIIQKFDTDGTFLGKLGGFGVEEGEFWEPVGITSNSMGYVFVSDTINNRVQVFAPTGSLTVTIDPAGANTDGAQWRIDGGSWRNSGDTATDLIIGDHTVEFSSITGWITPGNQTVSINAGLTTVTSGTYIQLGNLQVTIEPAEAIAAGAQWRVDGGAWQNSGEMASNRSLGSHTVEFKEITGWTKPATQLATISSGLTTSTSGTYSIVYYDISGTIAMGANPLEGVNVHFSHDGSTVVTDASGNYTTSVPFGTTTTITPSKTHYKFSPATSLLTAVSANTTVDFAASFIFYNIHGTIKEGNTPVQGVRVRFSHDGSTVTTGSDGTYVKSIKSGTSTTVAPTKTYYSFSPTDSLIELIASNITLDFAATFNGGSVRIVGTKNPKSLNSGFLKIPEGAGWRIVGYGVGSWINFDQKLDSVPSGEYTIEFRPVPGFIVPANITVTVEFGKNTSITMFYLCTFISQSSDYDGDGVNDLAVFDPETNEWHVASVNSTAGAAPAVTELFVRKFGVDGSTPVPGDYNDDGTTDLAYWNAASGVWRVGKQFKLTGFGKEGDIPVPADYIGDGRTEPALYRPAEGLWLIYDRDSKKTLAVKFGSMLDIPVPGDYDGDGITDIAVWNGETGALKVAVYRQNKGTWKVNRKLGGKLGGAGHVPVPADYDGDGMIDFAVYRLSDSTWSIAGQPDVQFGNEYSVPMAIDWNGDGSAQITIFGIVKGQWRSDKLRETFGKGMRPISGTN